MPELSLRRPSISFLITEWSALEILGSENRNRRDVPQSIRLIPGTSRWKMVNIGGSSAKQKLMMPAFYFHSVLIMHFPLRTFSIATSCLTCWLDHSSVIIWLTANWIGLVIGWNQWLPVYFTFVRFGSVWSQISNCFLWRQLPSQGLCFVCWWTLLVIIN